MNPVKFCYVPVLLAVNKGYLHLWKSKTYSLQSNLIFRCGSKYPPLFLLGKTCLWMMFLPVSYRKSSLKLYHYLLYQTSFDSAARFCVLNITRGHKILLWMTTSRLGWASSTWTTKRTSSFLFLLECSVVLCHRLFGWHERIQRSTRW